MWRLSQCLGLLVIGLAAVAAAPPGISSGLGEDLMAASGAGTTVSPGMMSLTQLTQEFCEMRHKADVLSTRATKLAQNYLENRFSDTEIREQLKNTEVVTLQDFTTELSERNVLGADKNLKMFLQENEFKLHVVIKYLLLAIASEEEELPHISYDLRITELMGVVIRTREHCQTWLFRLGSGSANRDVIIDAHVRSPANSHQLQGRNYVILRDLSELARQMHGELEEGLAYLGGSCSRAPVSP